MAASPVMIVNCAPEHSDDRHGPTRFAPCPPSHVRGHIDQAQASQYFQIVAVHLHSVDLQIYADEHRLIALMINAWVVPAGDLDRRSILH
jgi:hypothetical protein